MILCFFDNSTDPPPNQSYQIPSMDDHTMSRILHACRLARELEANLPNLSVQPISLSASLQDVAGAFNQAVHELTSRNPFFAGEASGSGQSPMDLALGEGHSMQAMDLFSPRAVDEQNPFYISDTAATPGAAIGALGFGDAPSMDAIVVGGGESSSGSGRRPAGSSGQRSSRKRKDSSGTYVKVPAPRTGNMDQPPDDGYTWRKYGQKDILGSKFPRSYYRCTHKNFYGCQAKKQVQRLDEDPFTYGITYCGSHTCQTSPTPLILPAAMPSDVDPQGRLASAPESSQPPPSSLSTSIQLGSWFSTREFDQSRRGEGSGAGHTAGPSEGHGVGRDADCPVADLADAMFNSGSSGSSMDAIFLKQEKWGDKED